MNLEYIVIDGGSTDETLTKLEPYRDHIDVLISEPDKGIARASGDVIAILNSDDVYADSGELGVVAAVFGRGEDIPGGRTFLSAESDDRVDVVYGDLHYVSPDLKRVVRNWQSGDYKQGQFCCGWHPPHPSFFVKREIYERFGGFELSLRIAADYEFMLRVLHKHQGH